MLVFTPLSLSFVMSLAYLTRHQEPGKKFYEDPLDTVKSCVDKCEAPHEGKCARRQNWEGECKGNVRLEVLRATAWKEPIK